MNAAHNSVQTSNKLHAYLHVHQAVKAGIYIQPVSQIIMHTGICIQEYAHRNIHTGIHKPLSSKLTNSNSPGQVEEVEGGGGLQDLRPPLPHLVCLHGCLAACECFGQTSYHAYYLCQDLACEEAYKHTHTHTQAQHQ